MTATVTVTNTGRVPGKEVVQIYINAPKQKLKKPESELRAFAKTRLLQPGESQTLSFTITGTDLASFDPSTSSWVAESGNLHDQCRRIVIKHQELRHDGTAQRPCRGEISEALSATRRAQRNRAWQVTHYEHHK